MGIYDVEATPQAVYVTNLHVPFVTVVDPETGGWVGALDLREAGMEHPLFPRVESWNGKVWVSSSNEQLLAAFDDTTHELVEVTPLPAAWRLLDSDEDGLWMAGPDGLYRIGEDTSLVVSTDFTASAVSEHQGQVAAVDEVRGVVHLLGQWSVPISADLGDVLVRDGRVWVTDRRAGQVLELDATGVIASLDAGSDTFSLEALDQDLLVLNRQGAALPDDTYVGDPATVLRVTRDLDVVWTLDLDKTIHFADSPDGGETWWTANEDALRMSRFNSAGEEERRGQPVGLTIDHVSWDGWTARFGSHLTDTFWIVEDGEAVSGATCGWPFFGIVVDDLVHVPCQESGWVDILDADNGTLHDRKTLADTFHRPCDGGLCTGHDALIGGTSDPDLGVWVADPRKGRLLSSDGEAIDLGITGTSAPLVQHMGVVVLDETFVLYDPVDRRLVAAGLDGVRAELELELETEWPLVLEGDRVWAGSFGYDADLTHLSSVTGEVIAASDLWIITRDAETLRVFDRGTNEVASLPLSDLEAPPYTREGVHGPIRAAASDQVLVVASVFRGTLERRGLPDLEPVGTGIHPLGDWSDEPGVR